MQAAHRQQVRETGVAVVRFGVASDIGLPAERQRFGYTAVLQRTALHTV